MKSIHSLFVLFLFCLSWTIGASFVLPSARRPSRSFSLQAKKKKKEPAPTTKPQANHVKWQPFYEALAEYKEQNGDCKVSEEDNPKLHKWLEEQVKSYNNLIAGRKSRLTRIRAKSLEQLGAMPSEDLM